MQVRSQMSMLFHLDKCIGCHTCSVACKNLWTDRKGAEYMWWNNVETRPGSGYPTGWEDQGHYRGGWERGKNGELKLRLQGKTKAFANLFYNRAMPELEDYYEPFTYRYDDLFTAPEGEPDDLKKISGVGPALEKKLHGLGITQFEQVANFTAEDIEKVDDALSFKGRIERDDWVGQARAFADEAKED